MEVRGCSGSVQILDPQTAAVLISYPRHTQERILIDPACYEGPGTAQVLPPKPLGRMARKLQEIAVAAGGATAGGPVRRAGGGGPMTTKGGSHEPERPSALPAKAATADLRTLVDQLVKLGLDFAAEALPAILTRAVKEDMGSPALLEQLLRGELEQREERRIRTSLRLSGLPTGQTLANFDFAFQPAVQRSKLEALGTCCLAPGEAGALDPGPARRGKDPSGDRPGSSGGGVRVLGGVLPAGGTAARDAQGRRCAADASEGQEVHEGGAGDHRRGGFRDASRVRRRTCSSGW